jgi:acyl-CoA reductase-like NAD-dependent aldehyde dehydrogenase
MNARVVLPFINPATGEQFGRVEVASPAEVQAAVQDMRAAFPAWSSKPISERVAVLRELQRVLIDARDEISAVITQDTGKPRQDSIIEVFVTADLLNDACRHAAEWLRPERVPQGLYLFKHCYVERRPYGVVAVLGPWNYPLALSLPAVFSALLAGNTVVYKPSEVTAATGALIERLIKRVPALAPYVRVVHGDASVGAALVGAPPDYIFVTGSTGTGKKIMHVAAEHVTPLACELGGKDPMLVLADADVAAAAEWGAWGAFFNAGQTCMSVERVYVVAEVFDEFVRLAVAAAERLPVGHALYTDAPYQVGPITSPAQLEIIEQHVADAVAKGAKVLAGGRRAGPYYLPTVLVDVTHDMLVMQEETFGPILPIMRVADEAEAIRLANDNAYGLSAAVWSRDLAHARQVARQLQTGSAIINDTIAHFGVPRMPFGGMKASGFGRTHGRDGLRQFTQPYAFATGHPPQPLDLATILRKPGHYRLAGAIMRLAFGVTPEQRLEPVVELARRQVNRASFGRMAVGLGAAGLLAGVAFAFGLRRPRRRTG